MNSLQSKHDATGWDFDAAFRTRIEQARALATEALLRARNADGTWTGELSASALSTATAVTALTLMIRSDPAAAARLGPLIERGYRWLIAHQNADGGWGDTVESRSNISTTTLVWAACGLKELAAENVGRGLPTPPSPEKRRGREPPPYIETAERWLTRECGTLDPDALVRAIEQRYGEDRTFSIPILTMCALCGRLGRGAEAWRHVRQLPFEVAALPQRWFGALQLPVVSYALPALIAIGHVRHALRPTRNPLARALRDRCRARTLRKLGELQPPNGGFLEATPLTSFVVMSLAAAGLGPYEVAQRGAKFLELSARPDGSWPIDTNLATWVTTLSVNALAPVAMSVSEWTLPHSRAIADWLLREQFRAEHPYTLAAPGGWAWTNLPGGVPDADDTAGAILALQNLAGIDPAVQEAIAAGVTWLLDLQNRDGGMPTFCRGWGRLPFDRSSPDITAHAIRAWTAARGILPQSLQARVDRARVRAVGFLRREQQPDGTWIPLWFGHQEHAREENPLYGTARVVSALRDLPQDLSPGDSLARAVRWLIAQQNPEGGWSGATGARSSMEETGLAVEALADAWRSVALTPEEQRRLREVLARGGAWLCAAVEQPQWDKPAPIGFYFAKLWYHERLYPLIFAAGALTRLADAVAPRP